MYNFTSYICPVRESMVQYSTGGIARVAYNTTVASRGSTLLDFTWATLYWVTYYY